MFDQYLKAIWIILPATLITVVLEGVRSTWAPKSAGASRGSSLFGMLVFGLGFGFLAILAFNWVSAAWPASPARSYLWLAGGAAVVLTILAAAMPVFFKFHWKDVAVWTILNFAWGLGYGIFLPQVLGASTGAI